MPWRVDRLLIDQDGVDHPAHLDQLLPVPAVASEARDLARADGAVMSFQCLDRRIPDQQLLKEEVDAWEADRNKKHAKADWWFTDEDARVKLKRLYPAL